MHEADPQAINAATRPEDGYDTRDMKIAHIWKHIVGFFFFTGIMIGFVIVLYNWVLPWRYEGGMLRARTEPAIIPAEPHPLIQNGHEAIMDIVELKKGEMKKLNSYGESDATKGAVRVPIGRAIEMVSEEGLNPKTPNAATSGAEVNNG